MLEMLLSPRKAERHPWEMLFVGLFYASIAILLVEWIFSSDVVLSKYSGILLVTFIVMFSLPFMYFLIKNEEEKDLKYSGYLRILREHNKALMSLLWLFLGIVVALSIWYMILPTTNSFKAQIETFCVINQPGDYQKCAEEYHIGGQTNTTGNFTSKERFFMIFANNIYVLIFTILFSLIFGAGAIFILAWNASVIAAAVGISSENGLMNIPLSLARYIIHGLPEISAYFIGAIAGGIISVAVIKHDLGSDKFWKILRDVLNLVVIAIGVLILAALIEVFITPAIF